MKQAKKKLDLEKLIHFKIQASRVFQLQKRTPNYNFSLHFVSTVYLGEAVGKKLNASIVIIQHTSPKGR